MKHRIVQYGDDRFVLEEKTFLFWYKMSDKYSTIGRQYSTYTRAREVLKEYIEEGHLQKIKLEAEQFRQKNVKIHHINGEW